MQSVIKEMFEENWCHGSRCSKGFTAHMICFHPFCFGRIIWYIYIYKSTSLQMHKHDLLTSTRHQFSKRSRPEMVWEASKIESSKAGENWESLYFPIALIMNNQLIQPQCIMYIQFAFDPCVLAKIKINELNTSKTFPWQGARSFSSTHKFRYLHTCAYIFRDLHTFALAFKPARFFF